MNADTLLKLLQQVSNHECSAAEARERLRDLPFVEGAQTLADTHREIRTGLPEVVFARNKTVEQVIEAMGSAASCSWLCTGHPRFFRDGGNNPEAIFRRSS